MSKNVFADYFRCPTHVAKVLQQQPSGRAGFFQFGRNICYGQCIYAAGSTLNGDDLGDALASTHVGKGMVFLPFDSGEVINNLRLERYFPARAIFPHVLAQRAYYKIRRFVPKHVRWELQRLAYSGWKTVRFPRWPIDTTVEDILEILWILVLEATGAGKLPFIWFWPDGYSGAACMTHDVDTSVGLKFCTALMDIDDTFEIKSSFQLVPEERYSTPVQLREVMRQRGFEVNIHDLNHDGRLFESRSIFLERAKSINSYSTEFCALGFRSGSMYRNQQWYDDLKFLYDMSVPNSAHMEPQQGGCCTVMPYFARKMLVLPLTTTQDFALFHVLQKYSTDLWEKQLSVILQKYGLATFIVHPDYVQSRTAQRVYKQLLNYLSILRSRRALWIALPKDIARWWRQRSRMSLVMDGGEWKITGPGSERARIAYASLDQGQLRYDIATPVMPCRRGLPVSSGNFADRPRPDVIGS